MTILEYHKKLFELEGIKLEYDFDLSIYYTLDSDDDTWSLCIQMNKIDSDVNYYTAKFWKLYAMGLISGRSSFNLMDDSEVILVRDVFNDVLGISKHLLENCEVEYHRRNKLYNNLCRIFSINPIMSDLSDIEFSTKVEVTLYSGYNFVPNTEIDLAELLGGDDFDYVEKKAEEIAKYSDEELELWKKMKA